MPLASEKHKGENEKQLTSNYFGIQANEIRRNQIRQTKVMTFCFIMQFLGNYLLVTQCRQMAKIITMDGRNDIYFAITSNMDMMHL